MVNVVESGLHFSCITSINFLNNLTWWAYNMVGLFNNLLSYYPILQMKKLRLRKVK